MPVRRMRRSQPEIAACSRKILFAMPFARVYPLYVAKAAKRGRTRAEVDAVIRWLSGDSQQGLQAQIDAGSDLATFSAEAPVFTRWRRRAPAWFAACRSKTSSTP
jgi:hypothetical protein